jgi:Uma2 family endonuclease
MTVAETTGTIGRRMTEEEFVRLPADGRKWDLVDGEPREVPTSFEHDRIGVELLLRLAPFGKGRGHFTGAQAGFRMANGNIRCPDLGFTLKSRLPGGIPPREFLGVAPDLAVEIISPSEDRSEMGRKVREYLESGAQQVWQLFPAQRQVVVHYTPEHAVTLNDDDELDGGDLLPGFRSRVGDLFDLEA